MNREEAIAWLRSVGRNARARDWALGETIVIPYGEPQTVGDGVELSPGAVYLYPNAEGGWTLFEAGWPDRAAYADLETAARAVHEYIGQLELTLRKP